MGPVHTRGPTGHLRASTVWRPRFAGPSEGVAAVLAAAALGVCSGCVHPSAVDRARVLAVEHRDGDAVALLGGRLGVEPDDLAARRLLVRTLAASGDLPAARVEADELARRSPPGDPSPFIELGRALELAHEFDEALAAYDRAADIAPASPDGPRAGGLRAARWGEADAALPRLEEAVRRGARDLETWHALGLVRLRLGDLDGAEAAYRAGAAVDPRAPECWLGLATVAVARADAEHALMAYDEVLARSPRFAAAELGRAWALAKLGRAQEGARALDRAAELGAPAANVARLRALMGGAPDGEALP